jgi:hypothetical protein
MRTPTEYRKRAAQLYRDAAATQDTGLRDLCRSLAGTFEQLAIRAEMQADARAAIVASGEVAENRATK